MPNPSPNTKRLTTLILWALASAAAMIVSAILLKGNPINVWVQAALFIGAMTFGYGNRKQASANDARLATHEISQ
jgi:hypothetical protein